MKDKHPRFAPIHNTVHTEHISRANCCYIFYVSSENGISREKMVTRWPFFSALQKASRIEWIEGEKTRCSPQGGYVGDESQGSQGSKKTSYRLIVSVA
jgi:hypothetical protein